MKIIMVIFALVIFGCSSTYNHNGFLKPCKSINDNFLVSTKQINDSLLKR